MKTPISSGIQDRMLPVLYQSGLLLIFVLTCLPLAQSQGTRLSQQQDDNHTHHAKSGIRWRNLAVTIGNRDRQNPNPQFLLHPSSGSVENGSLCGIIGPSGAGKSTLLAALSGTTLKSHGKKVYGAVWYEEGEDEHNLDSSTSKTGKALIDGNDANVSKSILSMSKGEIALLQQHDDFFSMLTPQETVDLASYLQLAQYSKTKRQALSQEIIEALGLSHVEKRRIGGGRWSFSGASLSGGERRRLSVALELVTDPKVFFADEPTTGLDSGQAQNVIRLMKRLARKQHISCICTLHQPRTSIWKMLDSFILLAPGGKMIYMGDRAEAAHYFEQLGLPIPTDTNPAEFFIDLVTIDTEDSEQASMDRARIDYLADAFCAYNSQKDDRFKLSKPPQMKKSVEKKIVTQPFFFRFLALLKRSLRQNIRDIKINLLRLFSSIGLAGLFSTLFKSVRSENLAASVSDRVALLSYGVISMTMMSLTKTLNLFGNEKPVVMREQMRKQYSSFDYLLSKLFAELPLDVFFSAVFASCLKYAANLRSPLYCISGVFSLLTVASASLGFAIGSITSNVEEAMTVGMPLMVILMTVGVINPSGVSKEKESPIIVLLKQFSPIKYAIEALLISEFRGMDFGVQGKKWRWLDLPKMGALALVKNGDEVLDALALRYTNYQDILIQLCTLSGVNLLASLLGLSFFGPVRIQAKEDFTHACTTDKLKSTQSSNSFVPQSMPLVKVL